MTGTLPEFADAFRQDGARMHEACVSFVQSERRRTDSDGVVVLLDGETASSAVATLAVEALGAECVYGLVLPSSKVGSRSAQDAEAIADALGIETDTIHLQPLLMSFSDMAPQHADLHDDPFVRDSLVSRLRMTMAYLAANSMDRLVVGSATRTELLLGSVTKHGDGAADLFPLGRLYRTETDALADELDLPPFVTEPRPTPGDFRGEGIVAGFDTEPETIDAILYRLVESEWSPDRIKSELAVDEELIERVVRHHRATADKRRVPPTGPPG